MLWGNWPEQWSEQWWGGKGSLPPHSQMPFCFKEVNKNAHHPGFFERKKVQNLLLLPVSETM